MIRRPVELLVLLLVAAALPASAEAQERSPAWQIAAAVLPLPDSMRAGAAVLGYRDGRLTQIRAGTNDMICLTDDPAVKGFHASCYFKTLEPFMARGRALRATGVTEREAIDSARMADIKAGRLVMAEAGAGLYQVFSDDEAADPAAGPPPGGRSLFIVYLPYATQASTGIATQPATNRPWLMFPGKPWAHVMINP